MIMITILIIITIIIIIVIIIIVITTIDRVGESENKLWEGVSKHFPK